MRILLLASLLPLPAARPGEIAVTNYAGGETIRYPIPLIRGTLPDANAVSVTVVNTSSKRESREMTGLAHRGRFIALAELVPGENRLLIRAGGAERPLTLRYEPQTNPNVVRVFYLVDRDGRTDYQSPLLDDRKDWRGKLSTAALLMQTFTAERLHDLGYGRRTFNLELDGDGRVAVRLLRGVHTMEEYHRREPDLWTHSAQLIARQFPRKGAKDLVVCAFTRFDPATKKVHCHAALGGGNLAYFGGGNLFAWPDRPPDILKAFLDEQRVDPEKIFSDSVGRHTFWAIASTTIGACLHELGHAFGLPHTRHPHDIMTRGIDRLNRAFTFFDPPHAGRKERYEFREDEVAVWPDVSAGVLAYVPHLALDAPPPAANPRISIRLDLPSRNLVASSPDGLRFVGLHTAGDCVHAIASRPGDPAPKTIRVPFDEIAQRMKTDQVRVRAVEARGNTLWSNLDELLDGPFVQAWRVAPDALPWTDRREFPDMDEAGLKRIVDAARAAELRHSGSPYADFLPWFPEASRANVAGYAVRTIVSDRPRKVRLLTGSDDALRVWLNGKCVQQVLALRGARADSEAAEAELRRGENTLAVEVTQGTGGWGLYLRIEDADGTRLELADDGTLRPAGPALDRLRMLLRGPFVTRWRFAKEIVPWTNPAAFVPVDGARLKALQESAASAELSPAGEPVVDFLRHLPANRREHAAAYVTRTIVSDRPRKIRLLTGSDDALRIWLNGACVAEVLKLRGAQADSETTQAELQTGENHLLVEVSQGVGGWGLVLRLQDGDGAALFLADDGRLLKFDP